MGRAYRKAGHILLVVLGIYGMLVVTHQGEFWPFSIYQMFSSAGRPWTRVMVREVAVLPPEAVRWQPEAVDALAGRPFAMHQHGVPQNDVAAYVAQTRQWTQGRGEGLRSLLRYDHIVHPVLAVYRVDGRLGEGGAVVVMCTPVLYLTPDTVFTNAQMMLRETSRKP